MRPQTYTFVSKQIDLHRVHLFDIVTQYNAVFGEDTTATAGGGHTTHTPASHVHQHQASDTDSGGCTHVAEDADVQPPYNRADIMCSWAHHRTQLFATWLRPQLMRITDARQLSLLFTQTVNLCLSLQRAGVDARADLLGLFADTVSTHFANAMADVVHMAHDAVAAASADGTLSAQTPSQSQSPPSARAPPRAHAHVHAHEAASAAAGLSATATACVRTWDTRLAAWPAVARAMRRALQAFDEVAVFAPRACEGDIAQTLRRTIGALVRERMHPGPARARAPASGLVAAVHGDTATAMASASAAPASAPDAADADADAQEAIEQAMVPALVFLHAHIFGAEAARVLHAALGVARS